MAPTVDAMDVDCVGASATRRRRDRRLRAPASRDGSRRSPPPRRWTDDEESGGDARDVRRPTGTEHSTSGTVGYVAAGPPSLVVSLVAEHDHVDQAMVQFLLQQSLLPGPR